MNTQTLTQVQEAAIEYLRTRKRPNDLRASRKASRMVRDYCTRQGYADEQISQAVRDMFDIFNLENNAE